MIEPNKRSREVITAGVLFLCLLGICLVTPLAPLAVWFMPIPLIVLTAMGRRIETILFAMILGAALAVLGLNWAGLFFAVAVYGLAVIIGDSIQKSESHYGSLITSTFIMIMLFLVLLALARSTGQSLQTLLAPYLKAEGGLFGHAGSQSSNQVTQAVMDRVTLLLPAYICAFSLMVSAMNLYIARFLLRRQIDRVPILAAWRLPHWSVPAYLIVLLLTLSHAFSSSALWWQLINNSQFMLGLVIGIQGLSHIWRWLSQYRSGRFWFMLVILAALVPLIGSVCVLIGLFDLINDSNRRNSNGRGQPR